MTVVSARGADNNDLSTSALGEISRLAARECFDVAIEHSVRNVCAIRQFVYFHNILLALAMMLDYRRVVVCFDKDLFWAGPINTDKKIKNSYG